MSTPRSMRAVPCDLPLRSLWVLPVFLIGVLTFVTAHAEPGTDAPGLNSVSAVDGTWSRAPFIPQYAPIPHGYRTVHDAAHSRVLAYDGSTSECYSLDLTASDPSWKPLEVLGPLPPARRDEAMIYDPVRERLIVQGGSEVTYESLSFGDAWALDLSGIPAWTQLTASGTAARRSGHSAIYDPVGDRMIVFGGLEHVQFNTYTWTNSVSALSLSGSPAWSAVTTTGTTPPGRWYHAATHDTARQRMLMFGGETNAPFSQRFNDVWALDLGTAQWSALSPSGTPPAPRVQPALAYDPASDRVVLFGGGYSLPNETWQLTLSGPPAWSLIAATTPPEVRMNHQLLYDSALQRVLMAGGKDGGGNGTKVDVWALELLPSSWQQVTHIAPFRHEHTAIYDSQRGRIVVFGGMTSQQARNDTWALTPGPEPKWAQIETQGPLPPARMNHSAIYDPARDRMIVFGGYDGYSGGYRSDVWVLTFGGTPTWSQLALPGGPSARSWHTAVYDADGDRMWVLGGERRVGVMCGTDYPENVTVYPGDAWTLSLGATPAWTQALGGVRNLCSRQSAVFDVARHRIVVYGGERDSLACYTGHIVSYPNPTLAIPVTGPPAAHDLVALGTPPPPLATQVAAYDSHRDRMIIYGGYNSSGIVQGDAWALYLGGATWMPLSPAGSSPGPSIGHTTTYVPGQDAMVLYSPGSGGQRQGYFEGDGSVWTLQFEDVLSVPAPRRLGLALAVTPNPSRGAFGAWITLPTRDAAVLEVYDTSGRLTARHDVGALGAGRHFVGLEGAKAMAPGLYFLRLRGAGGSAQARAVVLR